MKIHTVVSGLVVGIMILALTGCGHQTDEEVLADAVNFYSSVAGKYHEILNSHDDEAVVLHCQRFGRDFRTNSFWYNANLEIAEIAPLHRALHVMNDDNQDINRTMRKLECRMLTGATIYQKLHSLLDNLHYSAQVVRDTDLYLEEARVLEQRRLEEERLAEARRQTAAMACIACNAVRPVVVKETVVTRYPARGSCPCSGVQASPCNDDQRCGPELEEIVVE